MPAKSSRSLKDRAEQTFLQLSSGIVNRMLTLLKGRDMPPSSYKTVERHAKEIVTEITVYRRPITPLKILDAITAGRLLDLTRKQGYDDLYHLFSIVKTDAGSSILVEKNQYVKITEQQSPSGEVEKVEISLNGKKIPFASLIGKTKIRMKESFSKYTAHQYNCQNFIDNMLTANGINTPEARKFVLQPVEKIIDGLPASNFLKKALEKVTDLANNANIVMEGSGKDLRKNLIKLIDIAHKIGAIKDPSKYINASNTNDIATLYSIIANLNKRITSHLGKSGR